MKRSPNRLVRAACLSVCLGAAGAAERAWAQNPSADQIINSLRPGSGGIGLTRGIRPVGPEPAEPAAPSGPNHSAHRHIARTPAATAPAGAPSVNLTVDFETGSATLTPDAAHALDQLGQALSSPALAAYRFRIEGHTDTVGAPAANQALSSHRADAVADYLEHYFHVAASRLQPVGMGEAGLLVPTPPGTPNARNRRVEIVNIGT